MSEILKIQYRNIYIQFPVDEKVLESIQFAKDALEFMMQILKNQAKKEDKTEETKQ